MIVTRNPIFSACVCSLMFLGAASAADQDRVDACIDQLRQTGGPDGQRGEVLSAQDSDKGTLVRLRDAGGSVWRCLATSAGIEFFAAEKSMDDGEGAVSGSRRRGQASADDDSSSPVRVNVGAGESGAELTGRLRPGDSRQYIISASNGQNLYVRVAARGPKMFYQIFNPDKSFLLDQISAEKEYRGQLWQSGEHVVEVINRGSELQSYNLIIGVD